MNGRSSEALTALGTGTRVLFLAPAFTPYADDSTAGSFYLLNRIGRYLAARGWTIQIAALAGSKSEQFQVIEIPGEPQADMGQAGLRRHSTGTALSAMTRLALDADVDAVINWGHDAHPYRASLLSDKPFLNVATLCRTTLDVDDAIRRTYAHRPWSVGFLSDAQASEFGITGAGILSCPIDPPEGGEGPRSNCLLYAGRITKAKGLHHAARIARKAGKPLLVAGPVDDPQYLQNELAQGGLTYLGVLPRAELYRVMASAAALLQFQDEEWEEAFGLVTAEAQACGLPVIAYHCGANAEILQDGHTGFLVARGDDDEAIAAIKASCSLDRPRIAERARVLFHMDIVGQRYLQWIINGIKRHQRAVALVV